ncbi:PAS domain S-box protein [Chitinimonas koreensis]|uniref:PAS domain S-box protein n=1 Tax=Chitinimonas koreensis TaxID=356302 RepID=UPI0016540B41|nr:PAS domain S-box protein [Chitinimonas koreensis]QNM96950.1 PAS domain S-box protein [Chitinimonas koreensis]
MLDDAQQYGTGSRKKDDGTARPAAGRACRSDGAMKLNQPVTQVERFLNPDEPIVTRTDLKGVIEYANPAFVEISGFSHAELIGKPHNVVRHPDMPPEAFEDLWRTLKAGGRGAAW